MRRSVVSAGEGEDGWTGTQRPIAGRRSQLRRRSGRTGSVGVLVVDDSPVFRRGMSRAVGLHSGLELVGEADGGEAALEAIERLRPDVVLLDLRMPDIDGLEVLERLRDLDPPPSAAC